MIVKDEWMSEYQQNMLREIGGSLVTVKLVPNLRNKEQYIVHLQESLMPKMLQTSLMLTGGSGA
jgi:hypothetical protein